MAASHYQLLDESLLSVLNAAGERSRLTLPGLLARLSQEGGVEMAAMQSHQQLAWHTFLCQLAAIGLHRSANGIESLEISHDEAEWRQILVEAARVDGGGESAFALVVDDLAEPAFFQPPLDDLKSLKNTHELPTGELDTLITSKNHDVKIERIAHPEPEHWVYALVTLQTTSGFLGRGNYGVARMNGGFGSRPRFGYTRSHSYSDQFRRDVECLVSYLKSPAKLFGSGAADAEALLWVRHWDGKSSTPLVKLHPLFIEICRRVRLTQTLSGSILAYRGSSEGPRVDTGGALGVTGDPWTPIEKSKTAALTLTEQGFNYRKLSELLGDDWAHGCAGELLLTDGPEPLLWAQVLAGGQGKTGGWHERVLPVPEKVRNLFLQPDSRNEVARIARYWVEAAKVAEHKVLKPALLAFLQGGPDSLNLKDDHADAVVNAFDDEIDRHFFEQLFAHVGESEDEGALNKSWEQWLFERAKQRLLASFDSMPLSAMRKYRAQSRALGLLHGAARKHLRISLGSPEPEAA